MKPKIDGLQWLSAGVLAVAILLVRAHGSNAPAQTDFFLGNDDERWVSFQKGPCTLIEGVPIVRALPGVAPANAAMSSIVGYHERQLPILGPPAPGRIENLTKAPLPGLRSLNTAERSLLTRKLYQVQESSFQTFLETASTYPNQTDGAIRSHLLQREPGKTVDEVAANLARERLQAVEVEKRPLTSRTSFKDMIGPLKNAADAKKLALLVARDSGMAFVSVGYSSGGETLIVVDPREAEPRLVPAEMVLLPEEDRKSPDPWSKQARDISANRKVPVDEVTSCKGSRPPGLRFLNTGRIQDRADAYIFHSWTISGFAVQKMFEGR